MTGSPMLVMVIVLAAVTGCGPAPVTETRAATPVAFGAHIPGVSVEEALAYLEEHTLECAGPRQPEAKTREWLCRTEYADGSSLDVRLVGDQAGVSQLVGVARNASPDEAVSYLVGSVAGWSPPAALETRSWHGRPIIPIKGASGTSRARRSGSSRILRLAPSWSIPPPTNRVARRKGGQARQAYPAGQYSCDPRIYGGPTHRTFVLLSLG